MKSFSNSLVSTLAAALLAGCAVGPRYERPEIAVPAGYKEAGQAWKTAEPKDHLPRGPWWEMFGDPVLNGLVAQVEVANQNVRLAYARYTQAQALVQQARAGLLPAVNLSGGTTRGQNATAGGVRTNGPATTDSVSASLGWEADLWGRLRGGVDANTASAEASLADLESSKLSLQAQLVQSYFSLRILDAQIRLFNQTAGDYQKALQLTQNRYTAGVAAKSDVAQAMAQLKSTQAQAIDAGIARAQFEHSIAVLIGKAPAELAIAADGEGAGLAAMLPTIPPGAPAALLERRPDIAAAERRAASASAQIGVARAALFPALTLSASTGFRNSEWAELLTLPNRFWSIGPALAFTLFDGGLKRSQVRQAEAVYDQNVATYRQTVLTAFQDVEDNLVSLRLLADEVLVQDEAVRAAEESLMHALNQYKAGIVSYLNVITAQASALSSRNTALSLLGRRLNSSVGLVKAMGGGFDAKTVAQVELASTTSAVSTSTK